MPIYHDNKKRQEILDFWMITKKPARRIANKFKVSYSFVQGIIDAHMKKKYLTETEKKEIRDHSRSGFTIYEIMIITGRSYFAIYQVINSPAPMTLEMHKEKLGLKEPTEPWSPSEEFYNFGDTTWDFINDILIDPRRETRMDVYKNYFNERHRL